MTTTTRSRIDTERISCSNDLYDAVEALTIATTRWKLEVQQHGAQTATRGMAPSTLIDNLDRARRICSELARQVLTLGRTDVATAYAEAGWLLARDANERLDERHGRATGGPQHDPRSAAHHGRHPVLHGRAHRRGQRMGIEAMTPLVIVVLILSVVVPIVSMAMLGFAAMDGDLDGRSVYRGGTPNHDHYNNVRQRVYELAKARAMRNMALNEQRAREREKR